MTKYEAMDYLARCADGADRDFDEAVELAVAALQAQIEAEKSEPLTLDELREMDGEHSQFQWISVKDKLPEMVEHYQSADVLVCIAYCPDDPGAVAERYVSIDHVAFNCFRQGEFSCERDDPRDGEPSSYFVTHWMPLPELPKDAAL